MKPLTIMCGVLALIALIVVGLSELRTRRELNELRAAANRTADPLPSASSPSDSVPSAADLNLLAARVLSRAAAAEVTKPVEETPQPVAAKPAEPPSMTVEQMRQGVLAAYGKENRDFAWGPEAEKKLDTALRTALPKGSKLLSMECRSTMCRLEISHSDGAIAHTGGPDGWMSSLTHEWGGAMFVAGEREEGGGIVQTLIPLQAGTFPAL
jgi:hypothetical protein